VSSDVDSGSWQSESAERRPPQAVIEGAVAARRSLRSCKDEGVWICADAFLKMLLERLQERRRYRDASCLVALRRSGSDTSCDLGERADHPHAALDPPAFFGIVELFTAKELLDGYISAAFIVERGSRGKVLFGQVRELAADAAVPLPWASREEWLTL
jgi:hypothetical protein